jgi:hypothetical protein|eukprot:g9032.t1
MAFRGIESVSRKTNHETSERLQDLHPYFSEDNLKNFAGEVHRDQVERAFGLRAIEKLADLSRYPELSKEGRATTLRIVVALTSSQEEKQLAIKSGLIQSCTELLGDDDDFVREQAGYVLASLASGPYQAQPHFRKCNTVMRLTNVLSDNVNEVGDAASLALLNLSVSRRGSDMIVAAEGAVKKVAAALLSNSKTTSLYLVSALVNISRYFKGTELALDAGVVSSVIELLRDCPDTMDPASIDGLKVQTLNAIWNLGNHLSGKDMLIAADAVEHISAALMDSSTDARRCAAGALMALSVHEYGKQQISEFAQEGLTRLLQDKDDAVRSNAKVAIFQASENRDTRYFMIKELVQKWPGSPEVSKDLIEGVFGAVGAESLNKVLDEDNVDMQERAVLSLLSLASSGPEANNAVMGTLYIVEKLAKLVASTNANVREHAYKTLEILVSGHAYAKNRLRDFYEDGVNTLVVNGEHGSKLADLL